MSQAVLKNQVSDLKPELGFGQTQRKQIAEALAHQLADTFRLMINTQGVHWNAQGPLFFSIHNLTEKHYRELFEAIDVIAERIRALGFPAPQSMTQLDHYATVNDLVVNGELNLQIRQLIKMNEEIANNMRNLVELAEEAGDVKTADLMTERTGAHEQNVWMLRATTAA